MTLKQHPVTIQPAAQKAVALVDTAGTPETTMDNNETEYHQRRGSDATIAHSDEQAFTSISFFGMFSSSAVLVIAIGATVHGGRFRESRSTLMLLLAAASIALYRSIILRSIQSFSLI